MQLTDRQFRVFYSDFDMIIDAMREKIVEALKLNPNRDLSDRHTIVDRLVNLREVFHGMYHNQQILDNNSGKVMLERERLIRKISQLEKELASLKQNITL